jgi:hypothetical protein
MVLPFALSRFKSEAHSPAPMQVRQGYWAGDTRTTENPTSTH